MLRPMDAILAFPPILITIFVVVYIRPRVENLILTIALLYVPRFTRVVHAVTLAAKQNEYVEAARSIGASHRRVMLRTIFPNVVAPLVVLASLSIGTACWSSRV